MCIILCDVRSVVASLCRRKIFDVGTYINEIPQEYKMIAL